MFKIKVAAWFMRIGWILSFLTANLIGGLLGAIMFVNSAHISGYDWPTGRQGNWVTAFASLVAGICFLGTAYLVGGTRFGNLSYHIDRWVDSHKPHLIMWYHNGILGVVRKVDFERAKRTYEETTKLPSAIGPPVFYVVANAMTFSFSDFKHYEGKITGTMEQMEELARGCITMHTPFLVPGTSSLGKAMPVISLNDAYKLVHGRAKS